MSNAKFTRDEVILALDVLYFSGEASLGSGSAAIKELCGVLQALPIHPAEGRPANFRNAVGVSTQIYKFSRNKNDMKASDVGAVFHQVDDDFKEDREELHRIAKALRRNLDYFKEAAFGDDTEGEGFPEGVLLAHLHRDIERRDAPAYADRRCRICQLDLSGIYAEGSMLLAQHLTVPPTALDARQRYGAEHFITVCPNCHAALHRHRPWLAKEHCGDILR